MHPVHCNDDVYYDIDWRLKLRWESENKGDCAKKRTSVKAVVLMATPCTKLKGGESGVQRQQRGGEAHIAWSTIAGVSWSGADDRQC
jgi:hypothetical protein